MREQWNVKSWGIKTGEKQCWKQGLFESQGKASFRCLNLGWSTQNSFGNKLLGPNPNPSLFNFLGLLDYHLFVLLGQFLLALLPMPFLKCGCFSAFLFRTRCMSPWPTEPSGPWPRSLPWFLFLFHFHQLLYLNSSQTFHPNWHTLLSDTNNSSWISVLAPNCCSELWPCPLSQFVCQTAISEPFGADLYCPWKTVGLLSILPKAFGDLPSAHLPLQPDLLPPISLCPSHWRTEALLTPLRGFVYMPCLLGTPFPPLSQYSAQEPSPLRSLCWQLPLSLTQLLFTVFTALYYGYLLTSHHTVWGSGAVWVLWSQLIRVHIEVLPPHQLWGPSQLNPSVLGFPHLRVRIIMTPTSQVTVRMKWANTCRVLGAENGT